MEPFEIELTGVLFTVQPQENGNFKIFDGANYLGEIEPIINDDTSVKWVTADLMGADFANQLGELIEEKEM
ncbi:hypothetical protein [Pedobacter cryotolerans]|uniref:Uncharacterized protein n=1 Tax=Pedobacter cryotolerans TaxID=2571270 RepID=A0A4V5NYP1_9SPHI|nr:hypothetical protein [Pedobacter cryotolerans]TKC03464.1 hypothetical protein FA045_02530 [Pedobacter cryotolerans]